MANSWYAYDGLGDPYNVSSYRRVTVKPTCTSGVDICSVYLLGETSTTPLSPFTTAILNYITAALATQVPQPHDGPTLKPYVYSRGQ